MGSFTWPQPPNAREILAYATQKHDREQWLEVRRGGIGGSDIASILGCGFDSPYVVWLDKTGRLPPKPDHWLFERGRRLEPAIAGWFADTTGLYLMKTGTWARIDQPWMRCNPDRFTHEAPGGGLEIKAVGPDWQEKWRDGPAAYALAQALWCLAVTEAEHWWIAADLGFYPGFAKWRIDREDYSDAIDRIVEIAARFWHDHVLADEPPPMDGDDSTTEALGRAYPADRVPRYDRKHPDATEPFTALIPGLAAARARRDALKSSLKTLEEELATIDNDVRAAIGAAEAAADEATGRVLFTWRAQTNKQGKTSRVLRAVGN